VSFVRHIELQNFDRPSHDERYAYQFTQYQFTHLYLTFLSKIFFYYFIFITNGYELFDKCKMYCR